VMADVYPTARQRPALLAFADALGSASTALPRDDKGDWRIKPSTVRERQAIPSRLPANLPTRSGDTGRNSGASGQGDPHAGDLLRLSGECE
jgi:hypothetical protein